MKYSKFAKHSEARKQLKGNIYAERSEAENFSKNNHKLYTRASESGSPG